MMEYGRIVTMQFGFRTRPKTFNYEFVSLDIKALQDIGDVKQLRSLLDGISSGQK